MPYLLIRHTIGNYAQWKPEFDDFASKRKALGSKGGYLFRNADNPDEIVILLEWDTLENARLHAQSDELRQAMQRAGVKTRPDVYFIEEIEKVSN